MQSGPDSVILFCYFGAKVCMTFARGFKMDELANGAVFENRPSTSSQNADLLPCAQAVHMDLNHVLCVSGKRTGECNSKMNESANEAAENRPSTSSQDPIVLPHACGQAVEQTVTYVSSSNVQNRNHAASVCVDSLVIEDIVSKLNDKYGKHGVKLFDFLQDKTRRDCNQDEDKDLPKWVYDEIINRFSNMTKNSDNTRRDCENDCVCDQIQDQGIPKEVYDDILNRIKNMTNDNDHFESRKNKLDKRLFEENNIVVLDSESFEVLGKSGKLKALQMKEPKCIECPMCHGCSCPPPGELASLRYIPRRNQSEGSSTDEEKSTRKKRRHRRCRTPHRPRTHSRRACRSRSSHSKSF